MASYRMYFTLKDLNNRDIIFFDYKNDKVEDIIFYYRECTRMQVVTKEVMAILKPFLYEKNYFLEEYEYKLESCNKQDLEDMFDNLIKQIKSLKEDY